MVGTILLANVLNVSAQGTTRKIITEKKTSQGRMVDPQSEVITAPQIAELEVSQTKCDTTFRFDHDGTVDLQNARALALSAFQKHHDADIIVGALMNTRMTAQYIEVNIEGFPARYSKIRPATREDLWMLDFINYGTILSPSQNNTLHHEKITLPFILSDMAPSVFFGSNHSRRIDYYSNIIRS